MRSDSGHAQRIKQYENTGSGMVRLCGTMHRENIRRKQRKETAEYENTGRTIGARMVLDPLGTFLGHRITIKRKNGSEEDFDSLFNEISKPRAEGVWITAVHDQGTISYEAYISNGERRLKAINPKTNKIYWDTMTINIIPMEANYKE